MAKAYVPTGRPPGRPPKPAVEKEGIRDVAAMLKDTTVDRATRPMNAICPDCYPAGWAGFQAPDGMLLTANCTHGTWMRRL